MGARVAHGRGRLLAGEGRQEPEHLREAEVEPPELPRARYHALQARF
jgi:hypothetical protein